MGNRLEIIREVVDQLLLRISDSEERRCAYVHLYGVSQICAVLAIRRGLDHEMATVAGMLHDIYSYTTGIVPLHSHNGAEMARPLLRELDLFSQDEQRNILSAIFHHSDKKFVHGDYDELLKDADVLQHYLYNPDFEPIKGERKRLKRILKELKLSYDFLKADHKASRINKRNAFDDSAAKSQCNLVQPISDKRMILANVAEALAAKGVSGDRKDADYQCIVRYWPDGKDIFSSLRNNWCAAFVYHCCMEAGFTLPIRFPRSGTVRFCAVKAWYDWANLKENDFYYEEKDDFHPECGDIVIYRNLFSGNNSSMPATARDHIGIVLSCNEDELLVAEGNSNNDNRSAVLKRKRGRNIDGYIRIDNRYEYKREAHVFCL